MMFILRADPKTLFMLSATCFGFLLLIGGCGVKGDPEPPLDPPQIGRGSVNFVPVTNDMNSVDASEQERDPEPEADKK